jgi:hypothetical protein
LNAIEKHFVDYLGCDCRQRYASVIANVAEITRFWYGLDLVDGPLFWFVEVVELVICKF